MRSYSYLQDRGIIQNKRGIGYFVAENAYYDTLDLMKSNFVKNNLPLFFKTIRLLDMDFDELKERYKNFEKENGKDEDKQ